MLAAPLTIVILPNPHPMSTSCSGFRVCVRCNARLPLTSYRVRPDGNTLMKRCLSCSKRAAAAQYARRKRAKERLLGPNAKAGPRTTPTPAPPAKACTRQASDTETSSDDDGPPSTSPHRAA